MDYVVGKKIKSELKIYLCTHCGRLMARKVGAANHERGSDQKCPFIGTADNIKMRKFNDNYAKAEAATYCKRIEQVLKTGRVL